MRNRATLIFALSTLLIATAWPQLALAEHQITKFDPPGAGTAPGQGTFPQQNLNSGAIVGYDIDGNYVAHGFIRSPHGKYTIIDYPGAAGTQAFGINVEGTVIGWWFEANGAYHGYLRDHHGNFTTFDVPGAAPYHPSKPSPGVVIPLPLAINRSGAVFGTYVDENNVFHCFVRSPDGNISSFDPVGSINTEGDTEGIIDKGTVSGGYVTADFVTHGFLRDREGALTSFDAPGAGTTAGSGSYANTINDAGTTPGASLDNNQVSHGFIRFSDGTFVTFDAPGAGTGPFNAPLNLAQGTIAGSTNLSDTTAGWYVDANYTFDVPGEGTGPGQGVAVVGTINEEGAVIGWYADANGAYHGFIYQSEDD